MPFAQKLLFYTPGVLLGIIILIISIALAVMGLLLVRRFVSSAVLKQHNDVAGFIFATLGVTYAVLLAFMVVVVWQNFDKSLSNVDKEAATIMDVFRDVQTLPEPFRSKFQKHLYIYTKMVTEEEWKVMARGEVNPRSLNVIINLWNCLSKFEPKTPTEEIFFREAVGKMNTVLSLRNERIFQCKQGLNPLLWFVLITGGIITIVFTYFFGMENLQAHIIMTSLLTAIIALILFTILSLDFPFTGDIRISPEPLWYILKTIDKAREILNPQTSFDYSNFLVALKSIPFGV